MRSSVVSLTEEGLADRATAYLAKVNALPQEIIEMIVQDMTLAAAAAHHRNTFGLEQGQRLVHEMSHILVGLINGRDYQAVYESEYPVALFESAMNRLYFEYLEQDMSLAIDALSGSHDASVLFLRTLFWLIQGHTGWDREEMKEKIIAWDDIYNSFLDQCSETTTLDGFNERLKPYKVKIISRDSKNGFICGAWRIENLATSVVYQYDMNTSDQARLPRGSNGIEDFQLIKPFALEDGAVLLKTALPALKIMATKHDNLRNIKFRDLVEAIYPGLVEQITRRPYVAQQVEARMR
jgi:hypothetical protein